MATCDLEEFSFPKWYPKFVNYATEAIVIPIPNNVLHYLREGSLVLPAEAISTAHTRETNAHYTIDWSSVDDTYEIQPPSFPEFSAKLKDAMNNLGGEVFIKMNWKAPSDAMWITTSKNMKCTSLEDIYLLLKISAFTEKDISYEFKDSLPCQDMCHCVVLKRWIDIHPGSEFRCFVLDHELLAISQRNCEMYFSHIYQARYDIMKDIMKFFKRRVKKKFPLSDYTFDLVRNDSNDIILIDFNPIDELMTKSLLFTWNEIMNMRNSEEVNEEREPEFRFLGEDPGIQPKPNAAYPVPYEVEELCSRQSRLSFVDHVVEAVEMQNSGNTDSSS